MKQIITSVFIGFLLFTLGCSPPTFTPPGGSYADDIEVTLTSAIPSEIYFSTDGSYPTPSTGQVYSKGDTIPVTGPGTTTIMALSVFGPFKSKVATATYTIGNSISEWYRDSDGDGFGNPANSTQSETQPPGYVANSLDCDDGNPDINPDATELPDNGIDENCTGVDARTWYADNDGDGYGNTAIKTVAEAQPADYVLDDTDCDDADAGIHPGASDIPDNGIDENCSGLDARTWYADSDTDGYGSNDNSAVSESQPAGYVPNNMDCDDANSAIHPNAAEICGDAIDQNCDGVDLPCTGAWYQDSDTDGYGNPGVIIHSIDQPAGYVADNTDCNDSNPNIHPGATEVPNNGIDEDCTGLDARIWYLDSDTDGYGNPADSTVSESQPVDHVANNTDCNDHNPAIHPGAVDLPDNGIDENCTGMDAKTWYYDSDSDGYGDSANTTVSELQPAHYVNNATDCNDHNGSIHPGAVEIPDNGIDENCTGIDAKTWYFDSDEDGYGDPASTAVSESQPVDYVANSLDCNDSNASINPAASEIPDNGIDENCTGLDAKTWYMDSDHDGYGNPSSTTVAESQPVGYVSDNTDCNDANSSVHPSAAEICADGIDQDCDGIDPACPTTWYRDSDNDGYGNPLVTTLSVGQPAGYVSDHTDCNDSSASVHPGATEIPYDGIDQDCNGSDLTDVDGDGYIATAAGGNDCNDNNASIHPGATEIPYDGIDQDCNGSDLTDVDGDGYIAAAVGGNDCDDNNASVHPGACEIPGNGLDDDCSGGDAVDPSTLGFEVSDGNGGLGEWTIGDVSNNDYAVQDSAGAHTGAYGFRAKAKTAGSTTNASVSVIRTFSCPRYVHEVRAYVKRDNARLMQGHLYVNGTSEGSDFLSGLDYSWRYKTWTLDKSVTSIKFYFHGMQGDLVGQAKAFVDDIAIDYSN